MKKNIIIIFALCISLSSCVFAQTNTDEVLPPPSEKQEEEKDEVFVSVQQMPHFPGGDDAMFKYIADHIIYPKSAKKAGINGIVYINFIIDKNGKVTKPTVLRGIKDGEELNEEALRVIKSMPQWEPGYQNAKPARVQLTLPIKFKL